MTQQEGDFWIVQLAALHRGYSFVRLKKDLPDHPNYEVVIVDSERFLQCCAREHPDYVIGDVDTWSEDKRTGLHTFLDPFDRGTPCMPRVGIHLRSRKRWFGLLGQVSEYYVSFVNGRHRSRYLHYAGATSFPVQIHREQADTLRLVCGVLSDGP